jgi:putative glycosyltransferase (TIGR04348 family)
MPRPSVVIVSPALAAANNGNWQTAKRWAGFLAPRFDVRISQRWPEGPDERDAVLIALHARRSFESVRAWSQVHPGRGIALVLTGTDLYRDIGTDAQARQSLALAQRLVVLQERGIESLPGQWRAKARVIFQSTPGQPPAGKPAGHLLAVMVGHLRGVKSPQTLFEAARLLAGQGDIRIEHIGGALEPGWPERARLAEDANPAYRWLGALPHPQTLAAIRDAHVLVHTSAMEGGAHVILEAVRNGTPVLASRVPGNVGMLGTGYDGYFDHGDAPGLARLLERCRAGQIPNAPGPPLLEHLRAQCSLRAPLFAPETERAAVLQLVQELQESP